MTDPDGQEVDVVLAHTAWQAADRHREQRQRRAHEQGECLVHELHFLDDVPEDHAVVLRLNGVSHYVCEDEDAESADRLESLARSREERGS